MLKHVCFQIEHDFDRYCAHSKTSYNIHFEIPVIIFRLLKLFKISDVLCALCKCMSVYLILFPIFIFGNVMIGVSPADKMTYVYTGCIYKYCTYSTRNENWKCMERPLKKKLSSLKFKRGLLHNFTMMPAFQNFADVQYYMCRRSITTYTLHIWIAERNRRTIERTFVWN